MWRFRLTTSLFAGAALLALTGGCDPEAGEPCAVQEDNVCLSSGYELLYCNTTLGAYELEDCYDVCRDQGQSFSGDCSTGTNGWDVCWCQ